MLRFAPLALFAALSPAGFAQSVLTVDDDDPTADFSEIQAAVDLAAPGSVILVGPGTYSGFTVDSKPLRIVGSDPAQRPLVMDQVRVLGLPAGAELDLLALRLDNDDFTPTSTVEPSLLEVVDCAGTVWLDSLEIGGSVRFAGIDMRNCSAVVLSDSAVSASWSLASVLDAPDGIAATDSQLWVQNCEVRGGSPFFTNGSLSIDGGNGMRLVRSTVVAVDGSIEGGNGDSCSAFVACVPGDGGYGIFDVDSSGTLLDVTVVGGFDGFDQAGYSPAQVDPIGPGSASAYSIESLVGFPRRFMAPTAVSSGATFQTSFEGEAGEQVWLLISLAAAPFEVDGALGFLAPQAPLLWFLGDLDATGSASQSYAVPLPPGLAALPLRLQGLFFGPLDGFVLGTPRTTVVVSSGL